MAITNLENTLTASAIERMTRNIKTDLFKSIYDTEVKRAFRYTDLMDSFSYSFLKNMAMPREYLGSTSNFIGFEEAKKLPEIKIRPITINKTVWLNEETKMKHKYPNKYKLIVLYDNGTEYHINGVIEHSINNLSYHQDKTLSYKHFVKKSKAVISVVVPIKDVAAITIKKRDEIIIKRLKPCAVIKGEAYKRKQ